MSGSGPGFHNSCTESRFRNPICRSGSDKKSPVVNNHPYQQVLHREISQNYGLIPALWRWRYTEGTVPELSFFVLFFIATKYFFDYFRKPTKWMNWKKAYLTLAEQRRKVPVKNTVY